MKKIPNELTCIGYMIKQKLLLRLDILIIIPLILLATCNKNRPNNMPEKILVRIGDKSISKDEFIRRAEYTVRPSHCNGSDNLNKKIVLNSLIAEKLMAIEAGDANPFITSDKITAYLQGIKEQAMRQWQYENVALSKVVLDSAQLAKIVQVAGRVYNIEYLTLSDCTKIYNCVRAIESHNQSLAATLRVLAGGDSIQQREIVFNAAENPIILDSLFSKPLVKGQIVGPLKVNEKQFVLMQIVGWTDAPVITDMQASKRWQSVSEIYKQRIAARLYNNFIQKIMHGKEIDFYPDTFYKVTEALAPIYIISEDEMEANFKNSVWNQNNDVVKSQDMQPTMLSLSNEPFFKIDNTVWTVKDFINALAVHPLVFRTSKIKKQEFGQQLQLAIVDMIQDKYLTEQAYKNGYDSVNIIQRRVKMWRDNLNYSFFRSILLKKAGLDSLAKTVPLKVIESYFNAQVDSLQKKYSPIIEVDVDAFNAIGLTKIDLYVLDKHAPFPQVVPTFPLITTDHRLDYGRKLETQ
jgi:hypothetical protein